jgi:hypothetical protein
MNPFAKNKNIHCAKIVQWLWLFFYSLMLCAQESTEHVTPEQIRLQLNEAQAQFEHAKKLFNTWYTGPLITLGASMTNPGQLNYQPYLFIAGNYSSYDQHRHKVKTPTTVNLIAQPIVVSTGITPSVDLSFVLSMQENWKEHKSGGGFNDISTSLGFLINHQTIHTPQLKFILKQSFPIGSYKNLSVNGLGLNGTGAGAWQTKFALSSSKIFFWDTTHPLNGHLALSYQISTPIHVTGFNTYGGGFGTNGTVHPGNLFELDFGLELSISQPWVIALDVVYDCASSTKFKGNHGVTSSGDPASLGNPYFDYLSLAPALEYNLTDSMGLIAGLWFTVYGRSTAAFVQGIFSWYWLYPP